MARISVGRRVGAHHPRHDVGGAVPKVASALVAVDQVDVPELQLVRHGFGGSVVNAPPESDGAAVAAEILVSGVASFCKRDRGDGRDGPCQLQDGNVVL